MKYCPNCGAEVPEGAQFCEKCGASMVVQQQPQQQTQYQQPVQGGVEQKSKLVAGLLQLFLGSFGVGRFYLGYTGLAIGQIAATWLTCGLGALWPFIDGIMILCGSVKTDAKGVPLKD